MGCIRIFWHSVVNLLKNADFWIQRAPKIFSDVQHQQPRYLEDATSPWLYVDTNYIIIRWITKKIPLFFKKRGVGAAFGFLFSNFWFTAWTCVIQAESWLPGAVQNILEELRCFCKYIKCSPWSKLFNAHQIKDTWPIEKKRHTPFRFVSNFHVFFDEKRAHKWYYVASGPQNCSIVTHNCFIWLKIFSKHSKHCIWPSQTLYKR